MMWWVEMRGDDGPADHGTLRGLDDGRGVGGAPIIAGSGKGGAVRKVAVVCWRRQEGAVTPVVSRHPAVFAIPGINADEFV